MQTEQKTAPESLFCADPPPFEEELPGCVLPFGWLGPHGWRVWGRALRVHCRVETWRDVAEATIRMLRPGPWQTGDPQIEHILRILEWRGIDPNAPFPEEVAP